jgi:oligopeptidase B
VRDLADKTDLADRVPDTGGSGVWSADNKGFFYTRLDPNHRPSKTFYHQIGTEIAEDRLIYEEPDPGFFMSVGGSRLNDWIMVSISDHETSEYRLIPAANPSAEPVIVSARQRKAATSSSSSPMPTAPRTTRSSRPPSPTRAARTGATSCRTRKAA